jgi:hypothetical protein
MNDIKVHKMIGSLSLADLNDFAITTLAITNNIGCPAPIANAGSPQSVEAEEKGVLLDGSDSFYSGNTPSVKWKQTGGSPKVEIKNSGKAKATFDAPTYEQFKDVGNSTTLSFELTAIGAGDLKSTSITTVTVNAVNIPPVTESAVNNPPTAKSQRVTTDIDTSSTITLDATDKDGDRLTYSIGTTPNHGSLSPFDEDTGSAVYNPNGGYTGSDSFTFTVNDEGSTSNAAEVSITVNPAANINATSTPENENGSENKSQSTLSDTTSLPSDQNITSNTTISLPSNETD